MAQRLKVNFSPTPEDKIHNNLLKILENLKVINPGHRATLWKGIYINKPSAWIVTEVKLSE